MIVSIVVGVVALVLVAGVCIWRANRASSLSKAGVELGMALIAVGAIGQMITKNADGAFAFFLLGTELVFISLLYPASRRHATPKMMPGIPPEIEALMRSGLIPEGAIVRVSSGLGGLDDVCTLDCPGCPVAEAAARMQHAEEPPVGEQPEERAEPVAEAPLEGREDGAPAAAGA